MVGKEAILIGDVLKNDSYIVPIYQRNYEWDKPQIAKLIEDINGISEENYYLGTLVTFQKLNGDYELIDGQQRHTTLNLIKYFLKDKITIKDDYKEIFEVHNLKFQARQECQFFFEKLLKNGIESLYENFKSKNLSNGIKIIEDVFKDEQIDVNTFAKKFFSKTFVFRTELPAETELNHYFEIMNNRGEQLENHEILKADLMSVLDSEQKKEAFARIWDACSYLGDYVWRNFKKEELENLFTLSKTSIEVLNWMNILKIESNNPTLKEQNPENNLFSIIEKRHDLPEKFSQDEQEKTDKYRSVIDFPTFLLYVLSAVENNNDISFDDKKLLKTFKTYNLNAEFSEKFIQELLRLRFYFDSYIIKQDISQHLEIQNWGIRNYEFKENSYQTKETIFEDNKDFEDKIEMLQTMFYFSTSSSNKKDWLINIFNELPNDAEGLYKNLFHTFKENIKNLDIDSQNYPDVSAKIFYYFEYMLWDLYYDFLRGESKKSLIDRPEIIKSIFEKIDDNKHFTIKDEFNKFKFRQLNSKEHLLAQEIAKDLATTKLNDFGNLCLISSSENSSVSNHTPSIKKDRILNNPSQKNVSLKRLLMFKTFNEDLWNDEEIENHKIDLENVLNYFKSKD